MVKKVEKALNETQNRSAPGADGIGYRFIKTIKDTILREKIIEEVARNLLKRWTPKEWQNSRVVMISKPGKDHEKTKRWRLFNLINCMRKLEEKVVADELQGCSHFHKHQFGSVKERSAIEAALRTMARVQRCEGKGEAVGSGFWDAKVEFQNMREEEVVKELAKSEEEKRWILCVRGFFKARRFELEWDRRKRWEGETNLGAP